MKASKICLFAISWFSNGYWQFHLKGIPVSFLRKKTSGGGDRGAYLQENYI